MFDYIRTNISNPQFLFAVFAAIAVFATVLTAVVNISSTTSTRSVTAATIASGPYSAGDTFQIVLTPAGSSGSQGQGLLVTGTFDEEPA